MNCSRDWTDPRFLGRTMITSRKALRAVVLSHTASVSPFGCSGLKSSLSRALSACPFAVLPRLCHSHYSAIRWQLRLRQSQPHWAR